MKITCVDDDPILEASHIKHGGLWWYYLSEDKKERYTRLIKDMPYVLELNYKKKSFGVIHGDCNFKDWSKLFKFLSDSETTESNYFLQDLIWGRTLATKKEHLTQPIKNIDHVFRKKLHKSITFPL